MKKRVIFRITAVNFSTWVFFRRAEGKKHRTSSQSWDTFQHGDIRSKFGAQGRCQILITVGISELAFGRGGHLVGKAIDFDTSSMGAQLRTTENHFPPISILLVVRKLRGLYLNKIFSVQRKQLLVGIVLVVWCVDSLGNDFYLSAFKKKKPR